MVWFYALPYGVCLLANTQHRYLKIYKHLVWFLFCFLLCHSYFLGFLKYFSTVFVSVSSKTQLYFPFSNFQILELEPDSSS